MRAAFIEKLGPPEVIQVGELPDPEIGAEDVLIASEFAAVNPIDCYLRSGAAPAPLKMPFVLGCDLAGVVERVGANVVDLRVGDRVWTTRQGFFGRPGTYSEKFCCDQTQVFRVPHHVNLRLAAACGLVGLTAHVGLVDRARIKVGETLFVRGGSGGIGATVIQIAKNLGAKVFCTAGSAEKMEACRETGADDVVNYRENDWVSFAREICPRGIDVFWDATREPDLDGACQVLADGGRIVLMAGREARSVVPVGLFYTKQLSMHGVMVPKTSAAAMQAAAADMNRWLESGDLRIRIAQEFPLEEAVAAHRLQESITLEASTDVFGKILIRFG
ncbi:MAG: NADPH:quinone reductase [Pirellulaceae bacterium]